MFKQGLLLALVILLGSVPYAFQERRSEPGVPGGDLLIQSSFAGLKASQNTQEKGGQLYHLRDVSPLREPEIESEPLSYPYRDWDIGEPEILSVFALAVDIDSGFIFYQKGRGDVPWPIASITKLISALVVQDLLPSEARVVFSETAIGTEGIAGNFSAGEIYRARDLLFAMLVVSSNDAAIALEEAIGRERFVEALRQKLIDMDMRNTYLVEPTGLSHKNQSTVHDLQKLLRYLYIHSPDLLEITGLLEKRITNLQSGESRVIRNINHFAGSSNFLGGKTGFIETSGENLISLFQYNGFNIATIILGSSDRFQETRTLLDFIQRGYQF